MKMYLNGQNDVFVNICSCNEFGHHHDRVLVLLDDSIACFGIGYGQLEQNDDEIVELKILNAYFIPLDIPQLMWTITEQR